MLRYVSWLLKDGPAVPSGGGVSGSTTSPLDVDPASDTSSIKQLQPRQPRSRTRARTDASRSSSTSSERTLVDASISPQFAKLGLVLEENPIAQEEADRISIPELYYRCHNASHFPSAPPMARRFLLRFLSDLVNPTTEKDLRKDPDCVLSLSPRFDSAELDVWLDNQYRRTTDRFEAYLQRRKAGGEREMFKDRSDAVRWCRQSAVVKYVDGSWLQSTLQTTSGLEIPRAMQKYTVASARRAARVSWQVLSEELGDGDIEKEHCAVFERLMDSLGESETDDKGAGFGPAPKGDEEDFASWNTDPETGEVLNKQPYIAAMLQLAMCVSPNEFLPEILGFNLSYEGLPLHLLITAHELRQLKIDPYYFVLHISIDNSDSGHSAMAKQAVEEFLHAAAKEHGPEAADKLWRRVQAGFIMADSVRTTPRTYRELAQGPPDTPKYWTEGIPLARDDMSPIVAHGADRDVLEAQLLDIFRAKAYAANGLHCTAPARIGGKRIGEWLTPESLAGESGEDFMRALALSRAWVRPGPNSHNSRLINECEWGGRMFGAFTNTQVALMKEWAAALPDPEDDGEEGFDACGGSTPSLSSEELSQNLVRPYLQYLSGKSAGVDEEDLQASAYYNRAILPIDFSSSLRNVTSFPQWRRAAPRVYQTILEHPHGVRGVFRFENVAAFLLDLLPASTSFAVCASPSFVETLVQTEAPALRSTQLGALLPALFTSPALLEWMPAASPSKLASPLGMVVIKIQRSLYGFSSEESADTVGCAGMDDVHSVVKGVWGLACDLREDGESTLDDFRDGKGEELALPALILLLNSQPTLHLPILLGLQLGLNVFLHEPLSVAVWTPSPIWRERMAEIVHDSRNWIMDCIVIGSSENTQRGWEGDGDWNENVLLGFLLAKRCLC